MGLVDLDRLRILIGDSVRMSSLPPSSSAIQVDTEARVFEKLQEDRFDVIVLSDNMGTLDVIPLLKNIIKKFPGVPVYFSNERNGDELFDEAELLAMGVRARLNRTESYSVFLTALKEKIFEQISCNPEKPPIVLPTAQDLIEIDPAQITLGLPTLFELYSTNDSGEIRFLIRKGEVYPGVEGLKLFILKNELNRYLGFCDSVLTKILKRNSLTLNDQFQLVEEYGKQTLNAFRELGASTKLIEHAEKFSKHTFQLLDSSELSSIKEIKQLLLSKKEMEHSVQVSLVAGLIAEKMKLSSEKMKWIVGSSALLHDIGVFSLPADLQKKKETEMTQEEFAIYSQHPLLGVEILSQTGKVDQAILQAIAQHHERKNRKGYPKRLGIGEIHKIAEIIGLAEEFVEKIVLDGKSISFENFMKWSYSRSFSNEVCDALAANFKST